MPKYMVLANYTDEGLKGMLKDGGSKRRDAVAQAIESLGGKLEAFYFAFGDYDVVGIGDMPDNVSAAAFSLLITAAGGAKCKTVVLITPDEADQAAKKTLAYRPPGK